MWAILTNVYNSDNIHHYMVDNKIKLIEKLNVLNKNVQM